MPWIIGSTLVFVPTIVYLLSPSASNSHKAHSAAGHDAHAESVSSTSPPPEPTNSEATMTDDEGTEVPLEEVKESITQAVTQDSPKEAAQGEADASESPKSDDGAPGQTSETENEQSEKPLDGTSQSDEESKSPPEQSTEEVAVGEASK
ncbi:hypothetical protein EI94DRAFT_1755304 [Lactarius quietus]|nr:hypothetical protein EI94DRAFT_1755304 [Lactarius quietus]